MQYRLIIFIVLFLCSFGFRAFSEEKVVYSNANALEISGGVVGFEMGNVHFGRVVHLIDVGLVYDYRVWGSLGFRLGLREMETFYGQWSVSRRNREFQYSRLWGAGVFLWAEFGLAVFPYFRLIGGLEGEGYYAKVLSGLFNIQSVWGMKLEAFRRIHYRMGLEAVVKVVHSDGVGRVFDWKSGGLGYGLRFFVRFE